MAINHFRVFGEQEDHLLGQNEFERSAERRTGFLTGLARSDIINKVLHQTSTMTAAVARLLEELDLDALDEDHLALAENLKTAFRNLTGAASAESGLAVEDEVLIIFGGELSLHQLLAEDETLYIR